MSILPKEPTTLSPQILPKDGVPHFSSAASSTTNSHAPSWSMVHPRQTRTICRKCEHFHRPLLMRKCSCCLADGKDYDIKIPYQAQKTSHYVLTWQDQARKIDQQIIKAAHAATKKRRAKKSSLTAETANQKAANQP